MKSVIVVDASVAVKWFLPEADSAVADKIADDNHQIIAPDLFRVEVGSAITKQLRRGLIDIPFAREQCEKLLLLLARETVVLMDSAKYFSDSLLFSFQLNHAVSDCLYLALAQRLNVLLVTADTVFCDKAKDVYGNVKLL